MKSSYSQGDASHERSNSAAGASADGQATVEASPPATGAAAPAMLEFNLPPLQDPPQPIDVATVSPEHRRGACAARDSYIIYLLQRLRQVQSYGYVPQNWAELEHIPPDLRPRLQSLEKKLKETLRLAEVELSLQRAKLAREENRVRVMDEQVQKQLKHAQDTPEAADEDGDESQAASGRWKRMLSRRKREGT